YVVAGKAYAVFFVAHGNEQAAQFTFANKLRDKQTDKQHKYTNKIENVFRAVGANIPAVQGTQISNAVYAAGVTLLADNSNRHNCRDRLRDNRKVRTAHTAFEHRYTDDVGKNTRHDNDGN